jgi:hypothetical protein
LFESVLNTVLDLSRSILLEAPPMVEISAFTQPADGSLLLGLVNLSGQNGRVIHPPLPIYDLRFQLPPPLVATRIKTLTQGELSFVREPDGSLTCTLPRLDLLELIRIS